MVRVTSLYLCTSPKGEKEKKTFAAHADKNVFFKKVFKKKEFFWKIGGFGDKQSNFEVISVKSSNA